MNERLCAKPSHTMPARRTGFSLIELIVTIAVIALLVGILLPVLGRVRDSARTTQCLSNARQLSVAVNAFAASNQSRLPENRSLVSGNEYVTWRHRFAAEDLLTDEELWGCPSHPDPGPRSEFGFTEDDAKCVGDIRSSYALNGHVLWRYDKSASDARLADTVIRRPSHTILIAETNRPQADLRASPPLVANYYEEQPGPYAYWHAGRGTYAFLDGHAESVAFLDTGSPDCRWHNGRDLTPDPFVDQERDELKPHDHPDWRYLVPDVYLGKQPSS